MHLMQLVLEDSVGSAGWAGLAICSSSWCNMNTSCSTDSSSWAAPNALGHELDLVLLLLLVLGLPIVQVELKGHAVDGTAV